MKRVTIPAVLVALGLALPAAAEQFAVRMDEPHASASDKLKTSLQITEIDSFSVNGVHYVILGAPDEAYVEAYFYALGREAMDLHVLEADWTLPAMKTLPVTQRLNFLRAIACEFCSS